MWNGKRLLLGISGGIAAYKTPELIRLFVKAGAEVQVVATKNALEFVTKLTLETVSKNKVYVNTFDKTNDWSTEHIALNDWADLFLVAPATANILGKFAGGIADDALSTTFLAFNKPVFIAPAMNCKMYEHPAVQKNRQYLRETGVYFIEPAVGELACGDIGKGRMEEPAAIFKVLSEFLSGQQPWIGKKIMITAGPTYERIDPVRFIGNYSSGKMGFALAEACAERGAEVFLIAGPVTMTAQHPNIVRIDVESAAEMFEAATTRFQDMNAAILCAAVADFTPSQIFDNKKKRGEKDLHLDLKPTKDIAAALGVVKKDEQVLVGFALETDLEEQNAKSKLERKNLDFIVLNSLNDAGAGFRHDTNKITILNKEGYQFSFSLKSKKEVAEDILNIIADYF
jgi:phosphopantothenoylcysteine decarboxylase / phosphopantothenate---cysteine ligase